MTERAGAGAGREALVTTVVGSYPQPGWLIVVRAELAG
jgi:methionine synthase II (cobalamin-independent)